jgi:hypothetical protein
MTHGLIINKWYINKDKTCFVKPLEELKNDGKALCVFVATSKAHIQIYRTRRDKMLLTGYDPCINLVEQFVKDLASTLIIDKME